MQTHMEYPTDKPGGRQSAAADNQPTGDKIDDAVTNPNHTSLKAQPETVYQI